MVQQEHFFHCWWENKIVQSLWKRAWHFNTKLKHNLAYDLAIVRLSMCPKELKNVCTQCYNTFIYIFKTLKPPRCPSVGK